MSNELTKQSLKKAATVQNGNVNLEADSELGGVADDNWTAALVTQLGRTVEGKADEAGASNLAGNVNALAALGSSDPLEAMLNAQLIGLHNVTMNCLARAQLENQTFEGRKQNLEYANKLGRTTATLVEAKQKHLGKGPQRIVVEKVTVENGGQAIVGNVGGEGNG